MMRILHAAFINSGHDENTAHCFHQLRGGDVLQLLIIAGLDPAILFGVTKRMPGSSPGMMRILRSAFINSGHDENTAHSVHQVRA